MKIVDKYLEGDEIREFRTLNDYEAKTLLGSDHASQQLLASVYGRWIYCDCCTPTTIKRFTELILTSLPLCPGAQAIRLHVRYTVWSRV